MQCAEYMRKGMIPVDSVKRWLMRNNVFSKTFKNFIQADGVKDILDSLILKPLSNKNQNMTKHINSSTMSLLKTDIMPEKERRDL